MEEIQDPKKGKRVIIVMPAYNAAKTIAKTYREIPKRYYDEVIVVDDASSDETVKVAKELGLPVLVHERNMGYGANQKTCYKEALKRGADIVIMLHPDYQYTPKLVPAMVTMITYGGYDVVLASRILVKGALKGGMPLYKYISNRFLTLLENIMLNHKLSEYHTGYRAFTREVLTTLPLLENSDDFVFDNQMLAQIIYFGFKIGEISCPANYFPEASSINFSRSLKYGLGVIATSFKFLLKKLNIKDERIFNPDGKKLLIE